MLTGINIKDFAVIKELNMDLKPGLNIITGETGAGKSVIIEAISMALGSRADTAYVRTGSDRAHITLVVDMEDCDLKDILEELGVPYDDPLIISREIGAQSKSLCRVNGTIVPLSALNSICKKIADIHGQYDQQVLLDPDNHLGILDLYGGPELAAAKKEVSEAYSVFAAYSNEYRELKKRMADSDRQRDFLKFEYDEICKAAPKEGEDEDLEENIRIMENGEKLYETLSDAHSRLFGSDSSADSALGTSFQNLSSLKGISAGVDRMIEKIGDIYYELDDLGSELREMRDGVSFSQSELDANIERLELLNKLKRKYGGSLEKVIEYAQKAEKSLSEMDNYDDRIKTLQNQISASKDVYDGKAARLTGIRKDAAKKLEELVDRELSELNFNNACFRVSFSETGSTDNGTDAAEFLISTNTGEAPKPLAKIASGGELSRIMLALKSIIGDIDNIPTMIFDEIDTGISGATAAVVGDKLAAIAKGHQVICITHLPQIASRGESHFRIEKTFDEISTRTTVVPLDEEQRINEIARLMSGTEVTESARLQAKELLKKR